jgi:predicted DNA-binding helix-hairpin-helix protein
MRQITNSLIERSSLKGPGSMFNGQDINSPDNYLDDSLIRKVGGAQLRENQNYVNETVTALTGGRTRKEVFAPAGQTTQMIIGAGNETDLQILTTTENLYHTFKMKRVYYSAYVPVVSSPILPDRGALPPLDREHRLYQADWLLRFYGFSVNELLDDSNPDLDPDVDPKVTWALRHLDQFPVEINKASMDMLLRIPGIGNVSARRIVRQRRIRAVRYEDLKKMGVVLKRAKHFLTCSGKYFGEKNFLPEVIKGHLMEAEDGVQLSLFDNGGGFAGLQDNKKGVLTDGRLSV